MQAEGTAYSEAQRQAVMFDKMSAIFVTICLVSVAFEFANSNQILFMEAVEIGLVTPLLIGLPHPKGPSPSSGRITPVPSHPGT